MIKTCYDCGFYDSDFGCTCSSYDKWYTCPLEPDPMEEDFLEHGFPFDGEIVDGEN